MYKHSSLYVKTYTKVHYVPQSVNSFDTMHVHLVFRSEKEMEEALKHDLDFTSQRYATDDPQSSQPTEEDDSICKWYEGKEFVSPRWKFEGGKIQEDIKSIV